MSATAAYSTMMTDGGMIGPITEDATVTLPRRTWALLGHAFDEDVAQSCDVGHGGA